MPRLTRPTPRRFVVAEVALVLLVPLLIFGGVRGLLRSTDGTLVEQLTPTEPGYRAPVDLSPVRAVVMIDEGKVGGVVLVAQPGPEQTGGGLVVVPPTLISDRGPLNELGVNQIGEALGAELRLHVSETWLLGPDEWAELLGSDRYLVDNPDPVPGPNGEVLVAVGPASVGSDIAAAFLARPSDSQSPTSITVRQQLFWRALLESPPREEGEASGDTGSLDRLTSALATVAAGPHDVVVLPHQLKPSGAVRVSPEAAEAVIARFAPFPSASSASDRVLVQVLSRSESIDLFAAAAAAASEGAEVTEIGNTAPLDEGPTEMLVPESLRKTDPRVLADLDRLAERFGAEIVWVVALDDDNVVSLVVGPGSSF